MMKKRKVEVRNGKSNYEKNCHKEKKQRVIIKINSINVYYKKKSISKLILAAIPVRTPFRARFSQPWGISVITFPLFSVLRETVK